MPLGKTLGGMDPMEQRYSPIDQNSPDDSEPVSCFLLRQAAHIRGIASAKGVDNLKFLRRSISSGHSIPDHGDIELGTALDPPR